MNRTIPKGCHIRAPRLMLICTLVASLALLAPPRAANAASYTVTKTADTNDGACNRDCSLREALAAANAWPGSDTIGIPSGTYTLRLGELEIASDLSLRGAGATATIVDGGGRGRVLAILAGNVRIDGVTIQNGNANEGSGIENRGTLQLQHVAVRRNVAGEDGGGIRNSGRLTMRDSSVVDNQAETGGAMFNRGDLTITGGTIGDNRAAHFGGAIRNDGTVALNNVTIVRNRASGDGGGIYNDRMLTLSGSTLSDNRANVGGASFGNGGGLFNTANGTARLSYSVVRNNTIASGDTAGSGGGMFNEGVLDADHSRILANMATRNGGGINTSGAARLANSIVSGNTTGDGNGGGIRNDGQLTLTNSAISGNTATEDGGGGLYNAGRVTISGSTIGANSGTENGGGIYNASSGNATLINSTISGNGAADMGGGIFNLGGAVSLHHVTVTRNRADNNADEFGVGGGIFNGALDDVPGPVTLRNTILAGNRDTTGDGPDCGGAIRSLGHNLIQNTFDCTFSGDTADDTVGLEARLGPLANNGGPTPTHALLDGSPAIDAVPLAACVDEAGNRVATDQRGVSRPQGAACDVGAYER